jgi:hypothetical protein
MDNVTVITIASIVLANIGTTILLFTWATNHAAAGDKELRSIVGKMSENTTRILERMEQEAKDFHGRLVSLEERNKPRVMQ